MLMGIAFAVSAYLQVIRHYSSIKTGLIFTSATVGVLLSSLAARRLAQRFAQRSLILAGFATTVIGVLVLLLLAKGHPSPWYSVPGLFLIGAGVGLMLTPSVNVVQSAFPEEKQGEISGLSRSVSNLGSSFGTAIAGTIVVAGLRRSDPGVRRGHPGHGLHRADRFRRRLAAAAHQTRQARGRRRGAWLGSPVVTSLRLSTESDPWSISFGVLRQAAPAGFWCEPRWHGEAVRAEAADPGEPPWHRVTRVQTHQRADDGLRAVLGTDHPDGLTAKLVIRVDGSDSVAVTFTVPGAAVVSQSFRAEPGERFLGFGERSHAVSLDQGVIENYVGEGPYQPHEYPFLAGTVPPWAIRERPDATYFPLPWLLSTRGYGLSVDQDDVSYLRLRSGAEDTWSVEAEADRLAFTVYAGPAPLDALRRYTQVNGRQPEPQRWFFGPWYQTGHDNHVPLAEEQRQLAALARRAGVGSGDALPVPAGRGGPRPRGRRASADRVLPLPRSRGRQLHQPHRGR